MDSTTAHNTERYEMAAVARSLGPVRVEEEPKAGDIAWALISVAVVLLVLVGFAGWLLFA